jgi:hypothetical protein
MFIIRFVRLLKRIILKKKGRGSGQFKVNSQQSTVGSLQSAVSSLQSAVYSPQSAGGREN